MATDSKYAGEMRRDFGQLCSDSRYPLEYASGHLTVGGKECHLAIEMIVVYGGEEDVYALRHLLKDPDREKRLTYAAMLALTHNDFTQRLLGEALADTDEGVRLTAFMALLRWGYPLVDASDQYLDVPSGFVSNPAWEKWIADVLPRVTWDGQMQQVILAKEAAPLSLPRPRPPIEP